MRDATISAAGAVVFAATAPLVGLEEWAVVGTATLGVGAVGVGGLGYRTKIREIELDRAVEQLCPQIGLAVPSREALKASRWSNGWPGRPGRLTLRYPSAQLTSDPDFLSRVTAVVSGQMWGDYRIQKHDPRKRRVIFVPAVESAAEEAEATNIARAKRTVLSLLGPTGTITKTELDPATGEVLALEVKHEIGVKLVPAGYRARIERTVSANLPGRWRARWNLETDWVRFETRPTFPKSVWHPVPEIADDENPLVNYDAVTIPYGIDEDGNVMSWRPAVDSNMMLVGAPGSGKTVTAHTILTEIAARGWIVWVVDGKGIEFLGFQDWPNVQIVASQIEHQVAVIHRAWQVMEERYAAIVNGKASESDFEPLVLVLDEFADFRGNLLNWYSMIKGKGDPTKPRTLQEVGSIARKGRTARVHMVFATQRPDAEYFGGDMRDNFRMRVSMGRLSPQGAIMMWESPAIGTTIPRGCRGRATTINDDNQAVEIQTYRTADPRKVGPGGEGYELLDLLRPATARHERLIILDPVPDQPDIDTGDSTEEPELRFNHYAHAPWGRAGDHPHRDPVMQRAHGNHLGISGSTPMAILGLEGLSTALPKGTAELLDAAAQAPTRPVLSVVRDVTDADFGEGSGSSEDDWEGYSSAGVVAPTDMQIGDLVLVDEDNDQWGVVDSEPAADDFDEDHYAITWRGDDDTEGVLSVPSDAELHRRRPHEFAE